MGVQKMDLSRGKISDDIIGIDLGTTNSAVAIYNAGTVPTLLPIGGQGKFTVQSCVRWDGRDESGAPLFTVGEEAYKERYLPNVIYSVKRMMGSGSSITLTCRTEPPYPSAADSDWDDDIDLQLTPAEVSSLILKHIKERVAELYKPVTRCVITVPAYFNQRQIEDTLEASKLAGLECVQILKEPTSASYIYSQLGHAQNGSVLIYDLGGGTFDVTHMNFLRRDSVPSKMATSLKRQYGIDLDSAKGVDANDQYFCRVLGTYGDIHLGGDDIDQYMAESVLKRTGISLSREGRERLYLRCESFKKMDASAVDVTIEGQTIHISKEDLENAVDAIFAKTMALMSEIDMSDVSTIVLVGGSTKSQRLRDDLSKAFPGVEISAVLDPDATVALGAGAVAKAVANKKGLMYSDVLPLPIGILVDEKEVRVCIPRNTSMPYVAMEYFYTLHDNQKQITLHVFQGLSSKPNEDTYLGKLTLTDIPQAPAGEVCVMVNFLLNDQGRLKIVSSIDGQDREETLVIDNIFDVEADDSFRVTDGEDAIIYEGREVIPDDDFEKCFMPVLCENQKAMALFMRRRDALQMSDTGEVDSLEAEIFALAN